MTECLKFHTIFAVQGNRGKAGIMSIRKQIEELGKRIIDKLGKNSLTPLERWEKIRRFEEADRVTGSFAFWSPAAVGIQDISTREYYTNPEKMYLCQLLALERFGHDYPILIADNYNTEPEALGAKIAFAGDDTPFIVEPSLKEQRRSKSTGGSGPV